MQCRVEEEEVVDITSSSSEEDNGKGATLQLSFSGKYLDDVDFPKLVNAVINNQTAANVEDNIESALDALTSNPPSTDENTVASRGGPRENIWNDIEDESDDEVIELEFERAVEKVHTHTPHCPNCKSQITKVILRRRKREHKPRLDKTDNLFGCLSCFSIFKLSGNCLSRIWLCGSNVKPENKPDAGEEWESGAEDSTDVDGRTTVNQGSGQRDERRSTSIEILKCIVHGGLMESIASLSVISSAAAADATTLNIIALGLASVISGLFTFGHNLIDLKTKNSNPETDRYQELLGRRGHFLLHSTFAILSFLVFGIIPPAVYGFTFHKSDNKDYKILAVAAAAFTSILILAIGKAYVRRSQKFSEYVKTILYYITMAISASGVAYAAGDLIKMLMDRLGWFEPSHAAPSFVPDMISATPRWASY